jgi:hypothetical protein
MRRDKMGTGEGAQAYGEGHYLAENEAVGKEYRDRLQEVTAAPFDELGIPPKEWNAATMFARTMDPSAPDIAARDFAQWTGRDVTPELVSAFGRAKKPGKMYEARIDASPDELLDWDKPLSERQQSMLYPYPNFDKLKREDDELLSVLVAAAKAGLI